VFLLQRTGTTSAMTTGTVICENAIRDLNLWSYRLGQTFVVILGVGASPFRMYFFSTVAFDVCGTRFAKSATMRTLGYWSSLLIDMSERSICTAVSTAKFEAPHTSFKTYLNVDSC